jgi:hypothetical protein
MEQATAEQSYFMDQAFEMARKALDTGETPVGCVLVYENEIVGRGMNDTNRSMNVGPYVALQQTPRSLEYTTSHINPSGFLPNGEQLELGNDLLKTCPLTCQHREQDTPNSLQFRKCFAHTRNLHYA